MSERLATVTALNSRPNFKRESWLSRNRTTVTRYGAVTAGIGLLLAIGLSNRDRNTAPSCDVSAETTTVTVDAPAQVGKLMLQTEGVTWATIKGEGFTAICRGPVMQKIIGLNPGRDLELGGPDGITGLQPGEYVVPARAEVK